MFDHLRRSRASLRSVNEARVLHLSDLHLSGRPGPDDDGVDAAAALAGLLHDCRHLEVDLVVVSGDLADDGSPAAYEQVKASVGAYAQDRDAGLICCVGNHDDRSAFRSVLGTGHRDPIGRETGRWLSPSTCCMASSAVRGLRVVTLDSLVPGETAGELEQDQLDALAQLLREPAERGTLLVLHHPPIALDTAFWRSVNLRRPDALAQVIAGTDVVAVLCGHNHLQLGGCLGGVPVWVTPGVATRIDLTAASGLERAVTGAGASLVDLGAAGGALFRVVQARDPGAGRQIYLVDAATGPDVASEPRTT